MSCATTYISSGNVSKEFSNSFPYKYVAVSPDSAPLTVNAIEQSLTNKGFIVYSTTIYSEVLTIEPDNPVAIAFCEDAGKTDRGMGAWSQTVFCELVDLNTKEIVYQGTGEYMGTSIPDDFKGATKSAFMDLPSIGGKGRVTSIIRLPRSEKKNDNDISQLDEINTPYTQGTGWLIPGGAIVTCYHVVDDADRITVVSKDGTLYEMELFVSDRVNDIAILKPIAPIENVAAIPFSTTPTSIGSEVFTIGFPHVDIMGSSEKFTSGSISAASGIGNDPRFYQITVPVQSGNSGGPLFDKYGRAIGIVSSKLNTINMLNWTGDIPQNVNYAIKSSYITPLLSMLPDIESEILIDEEASFEELVKRVDKSIFLVLTYK